MFTLKTYVSTSQPIQPPPPTRSPFPALFSVLLNQWDVQSQTIVVMFILTIATIVHMCVRMTEANKDCRKREQRPDLNKD